MKDFGCCGGQASGKQACECIEQDLQHRVIPTGTRKLVGQAREYCTTTNTWLTRQAFIDWSKNEGLEMDPIVWFTEMGHGPVPPDVKL